ncbi:MAG: 6,7-dimethyl-8-ribityllumazine synthase [Armatimonadetes bacterium]|nr:6,7-dimethyl-8-ribityllumazine synthase [Armatimonadota bacterium]
MAKVYEGKLLANGLRFGIVVSRFNEFITKKLLEGALDALARHGAIQDNIGIAWVPGTFEIPIIAKKMASSGKFDAVICLGALIRGATPHFDYLAAEVTKGIAQTALSTGIPTVYGIITADTIEQAIERAGTKQGNKGFDAAETAIEMANVMKELEKK